MKFKKGILSANDNAPISQEAYESAVVAERYVPASRTATALKPHPIALLPGQMEWQPGKTDYAGPQNSQEINTAKTLPFNKRNGFKFTLLGGFFAGLVALLLSVGFVETVQSQLIASIVVLSFGATSLLALNLRPSSREWVVTSIWITLMVVILSILGFPLSTAMIFGGAIAMAISFASDTRLPAILGSIGLLTLAYFASPLIVSPLSLSAIEGTALIAISLGMLGIAGRLKSSLVMTLALSCLYVWGALWLFNSGLSQQAVSGFIFIAAAAQYKLGKAGLDDDAFGSMAFITCGWIIGLVAFLYLQWGYLTGEANAVVTTGKAASSSIAWIIGTSCAVACILVGGMSRHAHNRQSIFSIFVTTLALGAIPFAIFRPDLILEPLLSIPGLSLIPTIGLILGACGLIITSTMAVNGLRLRRNSYVFLGLAGLGAQIVLLLQPGLMSLDNTIVFGASLLTAGGIATLLVSSKT